MNSECLASIVIVAHSATISALHEIFANEWTYVAYASVSKFVETKPDKFRLEFTSDQHHLWSNSERDKKRARILDYGPAGFGNGNNLPIMAY